MIAYVQTITNGIGSLSVQFITEQQAAAMTPYGVGSDGVPRYIKEIK
jgi:hypothetical protein